MSTFTLKEKLACLTREVAMRKSAYPKWIAQGRLKRDTAEHELAMMEAIRSEYAERIERGET